MQSNLNIQKRNLNKRENILNAKIGKIPYRSVSLGGYRKTTKGKGRVVFIAKEKKLPFRWRRRNQMPGSD
jgi:hypothetical protein